MNPDEEDMAAFEQSCKQQIDDLVYPEKPEFPFEIKNYLISADSLGQDTEFPEQKRKRFLEFVKNI